MRPTFAISAGVLAGLGSIAAAAVPGPAPAAAARADAAFEGVRIWDFRGSKLAGVGTAQSLVYDRSGGTAVATVAVADIPGLRGDPRPVHLEAGLATGHLHSKILDATNGVRIVRADGTALTHSAHYDGSTRIASGHEPVDLQSARFHATGSGFAYDANSSVLDLDGPVDAKGRGP